MSAKDSSFKKISELVTRFEQQYESYKQSSYNETLTRRDFIDPFFKCLGWDVDNEQGYAEAYREVIHEDRLKISGVSKAPDYSFRLVGGKKLFFVEAKKPSVLVKEEIPPAYQIRRYGWSAKLPISIITDFEEFSLYDCTIKPNPTDKASTARIKYLNFRDYPKEFDFFWETFGKENVLKGSFDKFVKSDTHKKGTATVDKEFLKSLDEWRTYLATSIAVNNKKLDEDEINFAVQQIIDRLIFLRIAEDRNVEPFGNLKQTLTGDMYKNLFTLFKQADDKYNSGLFDFKKDRISEHLTIDNKVLKNIITDMYYPSPFAFDAMPVEIMGTAYEQFLGKVIRITPAHHAKIEEKPEVRKAGGVYYTPQYIVDYIVKNTVGKLCEGKTPAEISKLKIVDPACGSGSFLIGAYQYLLDFHKNYYTQGGTLRQAQGTLRQAQGKKGNTLTPEGNLTTAEKKRILLNNIFGVDIDVNAVEVTKLSLLLKCMEGETEASIAHQTKMFHERVLPTLDENIKCGNSLIDLDFYDSKIEFDDNKKSNPFNWLKEFSQILKNGGFDCIIGNPPYVRPQNIEDNSKEYFWKHYKTFVKKADLYCCFIEKGVTLLRENGLLCFIVSNGWLRLDSFQELRMFLLSNTKVNMLVDFTDNVFDSAAVKTMIGLFKKNTSEKTNHIIKTANIHSKMILSNDKITFNNIEQSIFNNTYKQIFDISIDKAGNSIKDKMNKATNRIGEENDISFGLKTGDDSKFLSKQKLSNQYKPLLRGANIHGYQMDFENEYVWYVPERMRKHRQTARPGSPERFEQPKVLIRDTGDILEGTFDDKNFYVKDVLVITRPDKDIIILKFLCGILNSKLMRYYYESSFPTLHVQRNELASLPIPSIISTNKNMVSEISIQVTQLLSIKEEIKNSKYSLKKQQLQSKIDYCENRINEIVYQLYGLTKEEIEIVEAT